MNKIKEYICLGNSYSRPFICAYARNKNATVEITFWRTQRYVFLADSCIIDPVRNCSASFSVLRPTTNKCRVMRGERV